MEMTFKWFLPFSQHACGSVCELVGVSKPMVFQRFRRYLKLRISLLSLSRVAFIILADILSSLVIFISLMWCILINNRQVLVSNLRLGCSQGLLLSYMGIKWAVNALDPLDRDLSNLHGPVKGRKGKCCLLYFLQISSH